MHGQTLLLRFCLHLHRGNDILRQLRQRNRLTVHAHLACFNPRHIQHVVNQVQKMLAADADFLQAAFHFCLAIHISKRDLRHAQDCIHRRADVMAHIRQKFALRPVRLLCRRQGLLNRLLAAHLLCDGIRHIHAHHANASQAQIHRRQCQLLDLNSVASGTLAHAVAEAVAALLLQLLQNILLIEQLQP